MGEERRVVKKIEEEFFRKTKDLWMKTPEMHPPLIISVAPTGAMHRKNKNPNLPEQPDEIAEDVYECYKAGASIVHVHTRDKKGIPNYDYDTYVEISKKIRKKCPDIIICNSGAGGEYGNIWMEVGRTKFDAIDANPDLFSLDMGPLNFGDDLTLTLPRREIIEFAKYGKEKGVKPEFELYNLGQFEDLYRVIDLNLDDPPYWCQFVMGMQSGIPPSYETLQLMIEYLPPNSLWSVIGVSRLQLPMNVFGIMAGGHVRTGMEDNIYYRKGELAKSNAQFVERIVRIADELGREVATPKKAREMLRLGPPKKY